MQSRPSDKKEKNYLSVLKGGFAKDLSFAKRATISIVVVAIFFYASFVTFLYRSQERLIFIPSKDFPETLSLGGLNSELVIFEWDEDQPKKAYGYHFKRENTDKVMVFFYGNAQSVSKSLDRILWFSKFFNTSILVADYPAYGKTEGVPGQANIDKWLKGYDQYLTQDLGYTKEQRLLWGLSLGGAVAARMAENHGSHALILESTFASLLELAQELYPFAPVSLFLKHPFKTLENLEKGYSQPVYLIHSHEDRVVPFHHAQQMTDKAGWPLLVIDGGHSSGYRRHRKEIHDFLSPKLPHWVKKDL